MNKCINFYLMIVIVGALTSSSLVLPMAQLKEIAPRYHIGNRDKGGEFKQWKAIHRKIKHLVKQIESGKSSIASLVPIAQNIKSKLPSEVEFNNLLNYMKSGYKASIALVDGVIKKESSAELLKKAAAVKSSFKEKHKFMKELMMKQRNKGKGADDLQFKAETTGVQTYNSENEETTSSPSETVSTE